MNKSIKKIYFKYLIAILALLSCQLKVASQTFMGGPTKISLETNTNFTTEYLDPALYGHLQYTGLTTSDPTNILILNSSVGTGVIAGSFDVYVKRTYTGCTFVITLSYHAYDSSGNPIGGTLTENKTVTVLPSIVLPNIYPGENINIPIQDNCGHSGCSYLWNISPASLCPTCGAS